MAETKDVKKAGNGLANQKKKNWFALGIIKDMFENGPATKERITELMSYRLNEKLLKRYGADEVNEAIELSKSSKSNADFTAALFYNYIKKDNEFIMSNLLQFLRAYSKGESRKFIISLVNETRKAPISHDEMKYLESFLRMAYQKKDEMAHLYAEQEILAYLNRRNRIKNKGYSELYSFSDKMDILREW